MKYIRTKYGKKIIDVSKLKYVGEDENDYFFCKVYKSGKESKVIKCFTKKVITKIADTIEELFDEFVVFDSKGKPQVYSPFDVKEWTINTKLFGAIWTDKGLIYVAKMNEKGELELL